LRIITILALSLLILLLTSVAAIAESDTGYYVRLNYLNNDISGDFDAARYFSYAGMTSYVPLFDPGNGFGITAGGYHGRLSGEVNYYFSQHDAAFIDLSALIHQTDMFYDILSFDIKYSIINSPKDHFSFFLMTGIGFPRIQVKDATDSGTGDWFDITYQGIAYNIGAGCSLRFSQNLSFDLDYIWRRIEITEGATAGYKNLKPVSDTFLAPNRVLLIGLSYHF
jgi:opacity protein-like surface antigen